MCMMLYIGSDNELPVDKEYQGKEYIIFAGDIPKEYTDIKKHFTKKYQYIIWGSMGCFCGLYFNEVNDIDDIAGREESGRAILSVIFDYIKEFVVADDCELVSCWDGDEGEDCSYKETININEFNWKGKFTLCRPRSPQDECPWNGKHMTVYK